MKNRSGPLVVAILLGLQSLATAGDPQPSPSIDFLFDGGSLVLTFAENEKQCSSLRIVHPRAVKSLSEKSEWQRKPGTGGSIVLLAQSNGAPIQLDRGSLTEWVEKRVAEMSERECTIGENAFVAAVVHTVSTGAQIRVWGYDGIEMLEKGNWSGLFSSKNANPEPVVDDLFGVRK